MVEPNNQTQVRCRSTSRRSLRLSTATCCLCMALIASRRRLRPSWTRWPRCCWRKCWLEQISLGNGLPGNGQVLHSLVQGLIQYLWIGPPELPHKALPMTSSESSWHVASSKLLQLVLGESASGKDTAMEPMWSPRLIAI